MKLTFNLIQELVNLVQTYSEEKQGQVSLESFILWLNREELFKKEADSRRYFRRGSASSIAELPEAASHTAADPDHANPADVHLTLLLHQLSKHFKLYLKKVLLDSDLVSMDGHMFLSVLSETESLRKMELIRANFSETPSGIEVIKRLLRKGFIEEFDDPDDGRSKRVRITSKGKAEYQKTLPPIRKVIEVLAGRLTHEKKIQLVSLMDGLNDFHADLHEQAKSLTLDQLLETCRSEQSATQE